MLEQFLKEIFGDLSGILITGRISGRKGTRAIDLTEFWNYPEDLPALLEWHEMRAGKEDLYFSPMLYKGKRRVKSAVKNTPVVWCDADTATPDTYALPPTIVVETSPGRYHCYWQLEEEAAPEWVEGMSKTVTYSNLDEGSDKGGWGLTKYLRLPGALNTKASLDEPFEVVAAYTGMTYTTEQMEKAFGAISASPTDGLNEPLPVPDELPSRVHVLSKIPADPDIERSLNNPPTTKTWSEQLWFLECALFRAGLTAPEVFVVVRGSACDKYARDNRPEAELWREVLRASRSFEQQLIVPDRKEQITFVTPPTKLLSDSERDLVPRTFVDQYLEWATQRTQADQSYHEAAALVALSTILAEYGHAVPMFGDLNLNLWFLLVGKTTKTYKTTSKKLMLELLRPMISDEFPYDIGGDASPEGLLSEVLEHEGRSVLFHKDEAHSMLASAKGGKTYMQGFNALLTELYDGWAPGRLRSTGKDKKMRSVPVSLNMLLLGTPEELAKTLAKEDFASGFMARFVFAIGQPKDGANTMEQADVASGARKDDGLLYLREFMAQMRSYWEERSGGAGQTVAIRANEEAWNRLNELILQLETLANESDQPDIMLPCVDRLNKIVLKVACLIAMSERRELVELPDMLAAIEFAEKWYSTLVAMITMVGQSEFSAQVDELINYLQGRGGRAKYYIARRHFNGVEPRRWADIVAAAKDQKWITQVNDAEDTYLVVAT